MLTYGKDANLRAPFEAVVVQRLMDEGSVVDTGAPIFRLHETGHTEARIGIPIDYAQQLKIGDRHDVQLDRTSVMAPLTALIPNMSTTTRTVTAVFAMDQDNPIANTLVQLKLHDKIHTAGFWLPTTALSEERRGLWTVYVVDQNTLSSATCHQQQVVRKSVEVLHAETDRVFVQGTLVPNDPVVATGASGRYRHSGRPSFRSWSARFDHFPISLRFSADYWINRVDGRGYQRCHYYLIGIAVRALGSGRRYQHHSRYGDG